MPPKPITAKELGKILYKEFSRESWGLIEPDYFADPPKEGEAEPENMGGLYEVLERIAGALNKRFGAK